MSPIDTPSRAETPGNGGAANEWVPVGILTSVFV
jgi:hypothetical protein